VPIPISHGLSLGISGLHLNLELVRNSLTVNPLCLMSSKPIVHWLVPVLYFTIRNFL